MMGEKIIKLIKLITKLGTIPVTCEPCSLKTRSPCITDNCGRNKQKETQPLSEIYENHPTLVF